MGKKNWYETFVTETKDNVGNPFRYILMGSEECPAIYMDSVWERKSNEKLWEEKYGEGVTMIEKMREHKKFKEWLKEKFGGYSLDVQKVDFDKVNWVADDYSKVWKSIHKNEGKQETYIWGN